MLMKKIIYFIICCFLFNCEVDNVVYLKPIMSTYQPQNVLTNSAQLGGETLGEGGKDIIEYGIVWSTNNPPTINDHKVVEGSRLGSFSNTYQGLMPDTVYYCSAYGINEEGVGYGAVWEFQTSAEAPCSPQNNYFEAESILNLFSGNYSGTNYEIDSTFLGGDYLMVAHMSSPGSLELEVHFDGDIQNLLSGAYPIITDLDFAFQEPNKAAVRMFYGGSYFLASNGGTVYIEREGDNISVTLCDVEVNGSINFNQFTANITSNFNVSL